MGTGRGEGAGRRGEGLQPIGRRGRGFHAARSSYGMRERVEIRAARELEGYPFRGFGTTSTVMELWDFWDIQAGPSPQSSAAGFGKHRDV